MAKNIRGYISLQLGMTVKALPVLPSGADEGKEGQGNANPSVHVFYTRESVCFSDCFDVAGEECRCLGCF